jgi:uncharacterized protein (TIGR03435 family)
MALPLMKGWIRPESVKATVLEGSIDRMESGNTLRANNLTGAVIALPDSSRVEMRSQSELSLQRAEDGLRIRLDRGGVIVTAAKPGAGRLYVQTKDVTVSEGAVFLVNTEDKGSRVAVIQGEVQVQQGETFKKLQVGEQVATAPSMEWLPVAEEIAWSRSRATHIAMLQSGTKATQETSPVSTFEVATIKRNTETGQGLRSGSCHGTDTKEGTGAIFAMARATAPGLAPVGLGRCVFRRVTLKELIDRAFQSHPLLSVGIDKTIVGGPKWIDSDAFDIEGKAENAPTTTEAQLRLMLQSLLTQRFNLKFHRETRDVSGYVLVQSKGGPKLTPTSAPNATPSIASISPKPLAARNYNMQDFANFLSARVGSPVVDKTGLAERYDFTLQWTPSPGEGGVLGMVSPDVLAQLRIPPPDPNGPSIFTALQEQLGLKLDAQKVPLEVLVIDSAEPPTEN